MNWLEGTGSGQQARFLGLEFGMSQPQPLMSRAWSGSSMLQGLTSLDLRAVKQELPSDVGALQNLIQALIGPPNHIEKDQKERQTQRKLTI